MQGEDEIPSEVLHICALPMRDSTCNKLWSRMVTEGKKQHHKTHNYGDDTMAEVEVTFRKITAAVKNYLCRCHDTILSTQIVHVLPMLGAFQRKTMLEARA